MNQRLPGGLCAARINRKLLGGPFKHLPPQRLLLCLLAGAMLLAALCTITALQAPWLGISFAADAPSDSLRITALAPSHPNNSVLSPGVRITGLASGQGKPLSLPARVVLEDPDVLPSYHELEQFYQHQSALSNALNGSALRLLTASGQRIAIVAEDRPLNTLPLYFWWQVAIGLACFLIGASVWAFRRNMAAAQLLFVSSIGALGFTTLSAIYSSRELALDGDVFRLLLIATHFSTILHTSALLALVWVYPRPLGSPRVPVAIFAAGALTWLADTFQLTGSALWSHYLFSSAAFVVGLGFVYGQWRSTRWRPDERAIMRWFVMALFFASLANILILKAPLFFGHRPNVGQGWVFVAQLLMYAGLALGVLRYRLFDLERWWFRTWLWFFAGLLVVTIDITLLMLLNIEHSDALVLSLLLAGWLYFPARQWAWARLASGGSNDMTKLLTKLTTQLIGAGTSERIQHRWRHILKDIFDPLEIKELSDSGTDITIVDNGLTLRVPALDGRHTQILRYPDSGKRLFSQQDAQTARVLLDIARHAIDAAKARDEGARMERERIMRDLHDDLGARLLSLVYTTENERSQYLARAAIDDLHGVLASAKGSPVLLCEALQQWCSEARRRLNEAGIQGQLSISDELNTLPDELSLPSRIYVNVARILREAISNSIRHGKPTNVSIDFSREHDALLVTVTDNGSAGAPSTWQSGHGLQTIQARAREIGATLQWQQLSDGGCQFSLNLPLKVPFAQ